MSTKDDTTDSANRNPAYFAVAECARLAVHHCKLAMEHSKIRKGYNAHQHASLAHVHASVAHMYARAAGAGIIHDHMTDMVEEQAAIATDAARRASTWAQVPTGTATPMYVHAAQTCSDLGQHSEAESWHRISSELHEKIAGGGI